MKMFGTSNMDVVRQCQSCFGFSLLSLLWSNRVDKLDFKYATCGAVWSVTAISPRQCLICIFFSFLSFYLSVDYVFVIYRIIDD